MRLKLGASLCAFALVIGTAFIATSAVSFITFQSLKVGGPLYGEIMQAQDLRADILPPPEYIIEPYLEMTLAYNGLKAIGETERRLTALRARFDTRYRRWVASNLRPDLKTMITEESYGHAMRFWTLAEREFLPALKRGDSAAASKAYSEASAAYLAHRGVVDRLVSATEAMNAALERQASAAGSSGILWQSMSAALALLTLAGGILLVNRRVVGPLSGITSALKRLAAGDDAVSVSGADRFDEIGELARSIEVLKLAEAERRRLQAEAIDIERRGKSETAKAAEAAAAQARQTLLANVRPAFERLSEGDLTVRLDDSVGTDFRDVQTLFNQSVSRLEEAVGSVVASIASIRTGLTEINGASNDLSQRTEQQATSIEQTVSALTEVTRGVDATADGAVRAQESAELAQKDALRGGEIVGQAVEAMAAIETSSDKISKIIGVIDEIAFQTNLLALNAGVEAARAGEAGRGFAVVAQEVRGLAQRSAEAAKEIKGLISTSSAQVRQGVDMVTASGRSLEEIVARVAEMGAVIADIAGSAREQARSLKEVATAADQMDKVTQQNAAMVEETTRAAENLSAETEDLAVMVEKFKTKAGTARHGAAKRPSSPSRPVVQMRRTSNASPASRPAAETWEDF